MLYLNSDEPVILSWIDPSTGFHFCARVAVQKRGPYKGKLGIAAPKCVKIDTPSKNRLESRRVKDPPPG